MKRLELAIGLSYSARGVNCKKGEPFLVSDEQAEKLLATGRFAIVGKVVDGTPHIAPPATPQQTAPPATPQLSADKISRMTKPELIALAVEKGIDISGCDNNAERAERICGVLGLTSSVQLGLE